MATSCDPITECNIQQLVGMALGEMSVKAAGSTPLQLTTCEYLNISVCSATSGVDAVGLFHLLLDHLFTVDVSLTCWYIIQ